MATPALESYCCLDNHDRNHSSTSHVNAVFTRQTITAYNIICIFCGSLGILGSLYQLFPRRPSALPQTRRAFQLYTRQNIIICLLAASDFLATTGIVVRSSIWTAGYIPWREFAPIYPNQTIEKQESMRYLSCAIMSGWIQYFYICTYFWTMCYAVDIYRILHEKKSLLSIYHAMSWGLSFVLTVGALIALYFPSELECVYKLGHLLPHFLVGYLSILVVMIVNPVLYWKSVKKVKANIMLQRGRFTDQERLLVTTVKSKFYMVIVVFFVCWGANILNCVLLLFRDKVAPDIFIVLWMAMAVLNPLQGFLNCLVYQGAGGFNIHLRQAINSQKQYNTSSYRSDSDEDAPLLSYRGARS